MLKLNYFLADIFILSAEKQPIKSSWRKIEWLHIGINVNEAAGQSVFHVHMHVIPRYKGDVPNPKGGVRGVIPNKQNYNAASLKNETTEVPKPEKTKAYTVEQKRSEHGNVYVPWDDETDRLLCRMYDVGKRISLLSDIF